MCIFSSLKPYDFQINSDIAFLPFYLRNYTSLISISLEVFKKWPFGDCIDYISSESPFGSISRQDCIRQCNRYYCKNKLNCSVWMFNDIVTELDNHYNNYTLCSHQLNKFCKTNIKTINCENLCPFDCINQNFEVKYN